jgi:hypothetical protein
MGPRERPPTPWLRRGLAVAVRAKAERRWGSAGRSPRIEEAKRRENVVDDVLVMVLAGGVGERLYPLTKERAKPAVYFGGPYRIIDFTLSNCIN